MRCDIPGSGAFPRRTSPGGTAPDYVAIPTGVADGLRCADHVWWDFPSRPPPCRHCRMPVSPTLLFTVSTNSGPRACALFIRMASVHSSTTEDATLYREMPQHPLRSSNVAIVGGGPSGLVAAKCMLDAGLHPTIFDTAPHIGGMWALDSGHGWSSLRTNISKFSCSFSDLWWTNETPMFPSKDQMHDYLLHYFARYLTRTESSEIVNPCPVLASTRVKSITRRNLGRWIVRWTVVPTADQLQPETRSELEMHESEFDNIVIASGFFSEPRWPDVPGLQAFRGEILHSCQYQDPSRFANKRVAVVGSSFSAVEIAAEIASKASSLIHIAPSPAWILPRYIPISQSADSPFFPLDLVFYRRKMSGTSVEHLFKSDGENARLHSYFASLSGLPTHLTPQSLHPIPTRPPPVVVSDSYPQMLASGYIELVDGHVVKVTEDGVLLSNHSEVSNLDAIIFCTGYKTDLSFLPDELKQAIELDPDDSFVPFLAHRSVFPLSCSNLAFVGMYRGTYMGVLEAQARWAAAVFSKKVPPPTLTAVQEGVQRERDVRDRRPRGPLPHSDYVGVMDEAHAMAGHIPEEKFLRQGGVVVPPHFGGRDDADSALKELEETCEKLRGGFGTAAAVFGGLQGKWVFERRITNRLSEPSGSVEGAASFELMPHRGIRGQEVQGRVSCVYSEEGVLRMSEVSRKCRQQYRYEVEEAAGALRVFFVTGLSAGKHFHDLEFFKENGKWAARGHHPCVNDTYTVEYQFSFQGCYLSSFSIKYDVAGPHKDYTSMTTFRRPLLKPHSLHTVNDKSLGNALP